MAVAPAGRGVRLGRSGALGRGGALGRRAPVQRELEQHGARVANVLVVYGHHARRGKPAPLVQRDGAGVLLQRVQVERPLARLRGHARGRGHHLAAHATPADRGVHHQQVQHRHLVRRGRHLPRHLRVDGVLPLSHHHAGNEGTVLLAHVQLARGKASLEVRPRGIHAHVPVRPHVARNLPRARRGVQSPQRLQVPRSRLPDLKCHPGPPSLAGRTAAASVMLIFTADAHPVPPHFSPIMLRRLRPRAKARSRRSYQGPPPLSSVAVPFPFLLFYVHLYCTPNLRRCP